jgi:hypothetical protein
MLVRCRVSPSVALVQYVNGFSSRSRAPGARVSGMSSRNRTPCACLTGISGRLRASCSCVSGISSRGGRECVSVFPGPCPASPHCLSRRPPRALGSRRNPCTRLTSKGLPCTQVRASGISVRAGTCLCAVRGISARDWRECMPACSCWRVREGGILVRDDAIPSRSGCVCMPVFPGPYPS